MIMIKDLPDAIVNYVKGCKEITSLGSYNKHAADVNMWFDWRSSPEGHKCWAEVNKGNFKPFFDHHKNLLKASFELKSYPSEKVGTKYILVNDYRRGLLSGNIVVLNINDDTLIPRFSNLEDDKLIWIPWNKLMKYSESTEIIKKKKDVVNNGFLGIPEAVKVGDNTKGLDPSTLEEFSEKFKSDFKSEPQPHEIIGTLYEVISEVLMPQYQTGDIVKYLYNDGSSCPEFINTRTKEKCFIMWTHLKRISNSLKLNTKEDVKDNVDQQSCESGINNLFLCSVSASVSIGTFGRGSSICSSAEEIRMGG